MANLPRPTQRDLGPGGFLAIAIVSLGGPLALAALYVPGLIDGVAGSAGLITVLAPLIFAIPLLIWLRYAREVSTSGGLVGFVEAAAGRRVALGQAMIWTLSYLLYILYTTVYIVYDILPSALPRLRPHRSALEVAIPVLLAAIVVGGRAIAIAVLAVVAVGQLGLVGLLAVVSLAHAHPASAFTSTSDVGGVARASANGALLFVCGSLPLFFGAEIVRPSRTMRRGLVTAYLITALAIVAAVFPLAANPAFVHADIPGMSVVSVYVGHGAAVAVGLGVAASVAGVMVVEYLALTRLAHAVSGISFRRAAVMVAVPLVIAGPVSLLNPGRFYSDLLKPSLVALWISQLVVVAVFPMFLRKRHQLGIKAAFLTAGAGAVMLFGLYSTIHNQLAS